ncbi:MAG: phospholipase/carboxylesterase [Humisphaera sp.]|nr:phospholipase/carboxylesterase [Humisphaera sp.]
MTDPHANSPILTAGPAPEDAAGTIIMIHGRGATAESILSLLPELELEIDLAAIAPQAANNTWYPYSFLVPLEANQPYLDSALRKIDTIIADLMKRGVPSNRIALLGFSQGACLSCEFAARHAREYAAVLSLSGGLIGPPGTPRDYPGSLAGTSVFLGCGDPDPHIPFDRVIESGEVFTRMAATVDVRRYPGMPHTINHDEIDACRTILTRRMT